MLLRTAARAARRSFALLVLLTAHAPSAWAHWSFSENAGPPDNECPVGTAPEWTFRTVVYKSQQALKDACYDWGLTATGGYPHGFVQLSWSHSGGTSGANCNVWADTQFPLDDHSGYSVWNYTSANPSCAAAGNFGQPKPDSKQLGGSCPNCANPINPATGNKYQIETDYRSAGPVPLEFRRTYNSYDRSDVGMGWGWRHNYSRRLRLSDELTPAYNPNSTNLQTPGYSTAQAACQEGWEQVKAAAMGLADTTAVLEGSTCVLYEGGVQRGTLPLYQMSTPPPNPPVAAVYSRRADGKELRFSVEAGGLVSEPDVTATLTQVPGGYQLNDNDTVEFYDTDGNLVSITYRGGYAQTIGYDGQGRVNSVTDSFGRSLGLSYDVNGRLSTLLDSAGQSYTYAYDAAGNLSGVEYPDDATRTYHYEDARFPHALTGITDENGVRFATWTYDGMGRAHVSEHAGGADYTTLSFGDNTTTITEGSQSPHTYTFVDSHGVKKVSALSQSCASCGGAASTVYDANGFVDRKTDFNGNVTEYTYNARGLEESRTEAYGTALARTITTQWHPNFHLPTQIDEAGRRTIYTYDASGNRLTETITDSDMSETRTTTWTYNSLGQVLTVNGPRTDVTDVTTYAYYSCGTGAECGQVHTITNALNHVVQVTSYDDHGNPLTIVDPNNVTTTLTYDMRQRLKTRTVAGSTTTFDYDATGSLDRVTQPGGAYIDYTYDGAHRLTDLQDNLGNRIHYTLDTVGNRLREDVYDPGNVLRRAAVRVFDALGRLRQTKNAAGQVTIEYGYDAQGNRTTETEFVNASTSYTTTYLFDSLNRVVQITDASSGTTEYGFDALDRVFFVKDPTNLTTYYTFNALGDLKQQVSPDTGTTTYTYDAAGNRKTRVDARNVTESYNYDALNRLSYNSVGGVVYQYDGAGYSAPAPFSVGRLTRASTASNGGAAGASILFYDARGNVIQEQRTISPPYENTYYQYDAADRVIAVTYPSGRTVDYQRNAVGQITTVETSANEMATVVADNVTYEPFGGVTSYTLGNGVTVARSHDLDGRVERITDQGAATVQDLMFYYDLRGNVDAIQNVADSTRSQTFFYDELSRLTSAEGFYGLQAFTYDAIGNRLTMTRTPPGVSSETDNYSYVAGSHRISSVSGTVFSHDAAGNITAKGSLTLSYGSATKTIGGISQSFDEDGQRSRKQGTGAARLFNHDLRGRIIAERVVNTSADKREYIWLDDLPLALETQVPAVAAAEVIVDNTDAGFNAPSDWVSSTASAGYYGADYKVRPAGVLQGAITFDDAAGAPSGGQWTTISEPSAHEGSHQRSGTSGTRVFNWSVSLPQGEYWIYVRYVADAANTNAATYSITPAGGMFSAATVDQRTGGGTWKLLPQPIVVTTGAVQVRLSTSGAGSLSADAVQFVPAGGASWSAPPAGTYLIYARFPASPSHTPISRYSIKHANGTLIASAGSQQFSGGTWRQISGQYAFNGGPGQGVKVLADPGWAVAADAIRFVPTATPAYVPTLTYYHVDHLGTPQKVTGPNQEVLWDASYEPFGQATLLTSSITQPLRFPGQYFDAETGLHQNWNRDYDPSIGRYLQSDPIGLAGGLNTYGYAELNPLFFTDPDGLSAEPGTCGCCSNVTFGQKEGGVVAGTVRCCGGSPVACINPNLCDGLSAGACTIRKDCTKRHEQMHVARHSTCSGVSEGGPAVPQEPFTKSSSECEAYRFDYGSCLSIAKCGGERTCIADVKRMRAFAKKQRDKYCKQAGM